MRARSAPALGGGHPPGIATAPMAATERAQAAPDIRAEFDGALLAAAQPG
jgi:hypothetical protein